MPLLSFPSLVSERGAERWKASSHRSIISLLLKLLGDESVSDSLALEPIVESHLYGV